MNITRHIEAPVPISLDSLGKKQPHAPLELSVSGFPVQFTPLEVVLETNKSGILEINIYGKSIINSVGYTFNRDFLIASPGDDLTDYALGTYVGYFELGTNVKFFIYDQTP